MDQQCSRGHNHLSKEVLLKDYEQHSYDLKYIEDSSRPYPFAAAEDSRRELTFLTTDHMPQGIYSP